MEPEIRLHLFNNRPRIEFNGVDLHVQDSSLDLFAYLAVENQAEYDRDELVQRLYESLDSKDNFRKAALGGLNKEIKSICTIYPAPHNMLGYDGSHVRVDVLEFTNLAKRASEVNSLTAYKLIAPQLLEAYDLYHDDFLNGYTPALYGLGRWIEEKQAALRELFHRLLERLVQYEILDDQYDKSQLVTSRKGVGKGPGIFSRWEARHLMLRHCSFLSICLIEMHVQDA